MPEQFLTTATRLLPYAAHHIYATGSMQRATVSTILVSTRSLSRVAGDALRVSPIVRSRQAAVAFPAGNRSVQSSPACILRSWGRGYGRTSKSRAFPIHAHMCRLCGQPVPPRSSRRPARSPRGTLARVHQVTVRSNAGGSEPTARREPLSRLNMPAWRLENRSAGASHRHQASSTARIDGHSRIGVRLSCGDFSNLRVFE